MTILMYYSSAIIYEQVHIFISIVIYSISNATFPQYYTHCGVASHPIELDLHLILQVMYLTGLLIFFFHCTCALDKIITGNCL